MKVFTLAVAARLTLVLPATMACRRIVAPVQGLDLRLRRADADGTVRTDERGNRHRPGDAPRPNDDGVEQVVDLCSNPEGAEDHGRVHS